MSSKSGNVENLKAEDQHYQHCASDVDGVVEPSSFKC